MFYYLHGELSMVDLNTCVVDCGGVGYGLTVSQITLQSLYGKVGQKVKLFTHLAVREDGVELFGFGSAEERACFNQLIGISGVGPKAAMSILSTMTSDQFSLAVCTGDKKAISKAPGIGSKTAERIILELKDKISKEISSSAQKGSASDELIMFAEKNTNVSEATEALMVLGYDKSTVLSVLKGIDTSADTSEIIRLALKKLAR